MNEMADFFNRLGNSKCAIYIDRVLSTSGLKQQLIGAFSRIVDKQFEKRYGHQKEFVLKFKDIQVSFTTDDLYSRLWLYTSCRDGRVYEQPVTELLIRNLKKGMCFIDVGASLGYYTVIASKVVGTQGMVYAFELDEFNYSVLQKNLEINKCTNVKAYHTAVSDAKGKVRYVRETDSASPWHHLTYSYVVPKGNNIVTVDCISLDEFCTKANVIPNIVKIDVEGAELEVFNGMKRLLSYPGIKLFCEVHPRRLAHFGHTVKQVVDKLYESGMEVFEIMGVRMHDPEAGLRSVKEKSANITTNTMLYAYHKK
jgi:FkbM family methyltransferase